MTATNDVHYAAKFQLNDFERFAWANTDNIVAVVAIRP